MRLQLLLLAAIVGGGCGTGKVTTDGSMSDLGGVSADAAADMAGVAMCSVPPCGGDIIGTWKYESECPAAATWCSVVNPSYTATITFNADNTYVLVQTCDGDKATACNCAVQNISGTQTGTYTYESCSIALQPPGGGGIALNQRLQGDRLWLGFANARHFTIFRKQ